MNTGPYNFPQPALDPVPLNRLSELLGNGKTNPDCGLICSPVNNYKQGMSQGTSLFVCVLKIPVFSQPVFFIQPSAS